MSTKQQIGFRPKGLQENYPSLNEEEYHLLETGDLSPLRSILSSSLAHEVLMSISSLDYASSFESSSDTYGYTTLVMRGSWNFRPTVFRIGTLQLTIFRKFVHVGLTTFGDLDEQMSNESKRKVCDTFLNICLRNFTRVSPIGFFNWQDLEFFKPQISFLRSQVKINHLPWATNPEELKS